MVDTIKTALHIALVELLRTKREAAGLRQQDVALRCSKPQQWIALIESGQRRVDVVEYRALARAIGFDWRRALGEIEDEPGLEPDGAAPARSALRRLPKRRSRPKR